MLARLTISLTDRFNSSSLTGKNAHAQLQMDKRRVLVHLLIKLCQQLIEPARQSLRVRGFDANRPKFIAGHPAEQLVILQRRFHDSGEIAQQGVALGGGSSTPIAMRRNRLRGG